MPESPLFARFRQRHAIGALVQPRCGLVTIPHGIAHALREPDITGISAPLGDLSFVKSNVQTGRNRSGIGSAAESETAWVRAVAEAAERYACLIYDERDFTVETAQALGQGALDLDSLPVCSAAELRDPGCPLGRAARDQPIRWTRGTSLIDGRPVMVPAIMVHLSMVPWPQERFWLQISTGVAAHTDPQQAIVSAICECAERDAIALTWLGRIPLPSLPGDMVRAATARFDTGQVRFRFFDATTDLGLPTVLSVQGPGPDVPVSMTCATAPRLDEAAGKALREAGPMRSVLYRSKPYPEKVADFTDVIDGAAFYADGNRPEAFDFLLDRNRPVARASPPAPALAGAATPGAVLAGLRDLFASRRMEVVIVDLTTDELREAGLWVLRAVIPALVPLSFAYRARYLGTTRLYSYLSAALGRAFAEADINPDPIPFA